MGFPSDPRFPRPVPLRRAKRRARKPFEISEDERTHVVASRFLLACGVKRIGVERSLIVLDSPTCPSCKSHLASKARAQKIVADFVAEKGASEW